MERPNIVLTGFMGCGKTTVGKLLARRLGYRFVDTDQLIEQRAGMSIRQIFANRGEADFRLLEREVAGELAAGDGMVIATGGGLMLDPDNGLALEATGTVFCLTAPPEEILHRVSQGAKGVRPLLDAADPLARIVALSREREKAYARFIRIDTSERSPADVAEEILARLR